MEREQEKEQEKENNKESSGYIQKINKSVSIKIFLTALLINLIIEILSKHSLVDGLTFVFTRPLQFLYGAALIFATYSVILIVKRKLFMYTLISGIWLIGGIVNCIVRVFRHTPFTAQDMRLIKYAFKVAPTYLAIWQMVLIGILIVTFIVFMVAWFIRAPKKKEHGNIFKGIVIILFCWFICRMGTNILINFGVFARNFANIANAYDKYGFVYCFTMSLVNSGIDKPKDYSEEAVNEIVDEIISRHEKASLEAAEKSQQEEYYTKETQLTNDKSDVQVDINEPLEQEPSEHAPSENDATEQSISEQQSSEQQKMDSQTEELTSGEDGVIGKPNIIFLQLESLFNPEILKNVTFSETVLPNLTKMYRNYTTGLLSVPSFGAGTANTEFEVISGMNLDDFGPGEYPYKTVLQDKTCESICFYIKKYGYKTAAIHDNEGTFYDRYKVFPKLGFDTFTSIEYMNGMVYNPIGWVDDSILTSQIVETLSSTQERDFIYTISVQGHGDYPEDYVIQDDDITADGEIIADFRIPFIYYINQAHEMDEFVGELTKALESYGEPVVLVMYGDHFPAFDITDDDLTEGNIYTTRYVMWDNMGLEKKDRNLESYELSSYVLELLGIEGGAISDCHMYYRHLLDGVKYGEPENDAQYFVNGYDNPFDDDVTETEEIQEKYLNALKLLEYDILYGAADAYGGVLPYSATNMIMGHKEITVDCVISKGGHILIKGKNFTDSSCVYINNNKVDTIKFSDRDLFIDEGKLKPGDLITVKQQGKDNVVLSSTSIYEYTGE